VRNCARLGRLSLLSPRGRDGRVSASEGKGVGLGEGESEGYDLLRQMTPVVSEPFTSRLRYATARQAVLSPFLRGERRQNTHQESSPRCI